MKRFALACTLLVAAGGLTFSQDVSMEIGVTPKVTLPLGASSDIYEIGAGGALRAGAHLGIIPVFLGGTVDYDFHRTVGAENSLNLVSVRAGGGLSLRTGRLDIQLGIEGGGFLGLYRSGTETLTEFNPVASGRAALGLLLGGGVMMELGAQYSHYFTRSSGDITPLYQGIEAFAGVTFAPGMRRAGSREPQIRIEPPQFDRVFPVFFSYYESNPLGTAVIVNDERGPISNIEVSLLVGDYMNAAKNSPTIEELAPGEQVTVPLFGLFNAEMMRLTQFTNTVAEVQVSYDYQGERLAKTEAFNMRVENRNVMTWADDRRAGAFVTPLDPAVLRFSRNVAALVRQQSEIAVSKPVQKAVAIFSAMELYGFEYVIDPDSSYAELSADEDVLDYLQFPTQTLDYHAGDCDDLSILLSALLESEQISTAFVTIPGHIFVAFDTGLSEEDARVNFAQADDLIYRSGNAWMPVETTVVDRGFTDAWAIGAQQWRQASADGTAGFFTLEEAQSVYTPVGLPDDTFRPQLPDTERILARYNYQIGRLVQRQLEPIIEQYGVRISEAPDRGTRARLVNRLGTIYAQYGRYEEASAQFRLAQSLGDANATFNLGNVAYLGGDLEAAVRFYEEAVEQDPSNAALLVSTAKAYFELENYETAADYFRDGQEQDPELAAPFAYIIGGTSEEGRASSAEIRDSIVDWGRE